MTLAAGFVARHPLAIDLPGASLTRFTLSRDRLSDTDLMDAASASPGRYVGEMLRRLRGFQRDAEVCLAFNPRMEFEPEAVALVLASAFDLLPDGGEFWLLTDDQDRPLAYALRAAHIDWCPPVHMALLSCDNADVDERLLRVSFGEGMRRSVGATGGAVLGRQGFLEPLRPSLWDITRMAAQVLEHRPEGARRDLVARGDRVAVLGFHAGDVLFLLQALALEQTPFRTVAVTDVYADIVSYLRPDLRCIPIRQALPHRGAYPVLDEFTLMRDYIAELSREAPDKFFHPLRAIFRNYYATRHHLREVYAFALGGAGHHLRRAPALRAPGGRDRDFMFPKPGRVLVQFDAGWALKGYPEERRGELLDLLTQGGYEPVLLGKPESARPEVPALPYTDLEGFRMLLGSADALIGCDSFPVHFAELAGVPTVALFGPTRTHNSRGADSPTYRYLQHPMPCVPCGQTTHCQLDGGVSCHAHATAGEVFETLRALLPLPRQERPPRRPVEEMSRLLRDLTPTVSFRSGPAFEPAAQERFLRQLFTRVSFERVSACPMCGGTGLSLVGRRMLLPVAACEACGLWFVQERIAAADLGVLYSEEYWTDFTRLHGYPRHTDRYLYDYVAALERVLDIAPLIPPGARVLDIGCALGALPRQFRDCGYEAAGLELDAALARKAALLSMVPVYTSLKEAQEGGPGFDLVTMFDVFEHLYDPVGYLRGLRGLLAPDGVLVLETFRTDSPAFQREGMRHEDVKPVEHPFMYRQAHIEELLRRAGLRPVRVSYPLGEDHARIRVAARWEPQA